MFQVALSSGRSLRLNQANKGQHAAREPEEDEGFGDSQCGFILADPGNLAQEVDRSEIGVERKVHAGADGSCIPSEGEIGGGPTEPRFQRDQNCHEAFDGLGGRL